jgi:hypothetical protein
MFVGVGQRASGDPAAEAGMVQLRPHGAQARFDVSETFAIRQLRKRHAEKLIEAGEPPCTSVAAVTPNALVEIVPREEIHQLSEEELPGVHWPSPSPPRWAGNG